MLAVLRDVVVQVRPVCFKVTHATSIDLPPTIPSETNLPVDNSNYNHNLIHLTTTISSHLRRPWCIYRMRSAIIQLG